MSYSPPIGYRLPAAPNWSPYGSYLPARVGKMLAFMPGGVIPFPSDISPSLWLDGRQTSYSDVSGSVVALPPLGRVYKAPQPSSLSGSFTASNTGNARPFRDSKSFCFEMVPVTGLANGGLNFSASAGATLPSRNVTIAFNLVSRDLPGEVLNYGLLTGVDSISGNFWGVFFQGGELRIATNSAVIPTGIVWQVGVPMSGVVQIANNLITVTVVQGGVTSTFSSATATPGGTINTLLVGLFTILGSALNASVSQILGIPSLLTANQQSRLLRWLIANPPDEAFPRNVNFLMLASDSIGVGYGLGNAEQAYSQISLPTIEAIGPQVKFLNAGFPGYTIVQSQALFDSTVKQFLSASRSKQGVVVQVGTNSLAFGSLTAAQWLAQYYGFCDYLSSFGLRVACCTLLPRTDGTIRGDYEANRLIVNADILANGHLHGVVNCNFAGVAGMSTTADTIGANYQADHVHPSTAGAALLAPAYQAAATVLMS